MTAAEHRPTFGLVIVGDEILSGKRQDAHLPFLISALKERGLELGWSRIVGDDQALLQQTFRETLTSGAFVFSFGGIGGTPDDLTRACAAEAFGVPLHRHPGAIALLEDQFGEAAYPNRARMADIPLGAELIPNPINRVAGFSLNHHHFVPGFPNMSHPMVTWVLDHYYAGHFAIPAVEQRLLVASIENNLVEIEEAIVAEYPRLRLSSLPNARNRQQVDLGLKGEVALVEQGMVRLRQLLEMAQISYEPIPDS